MRENSNSNHTTLLRNPLEEVANEDREIYNSKQNDIETILRILFREDTAGDYTINEDLYHTLKAIEEADEKTLSENFTTADYEMIKDIKEFMESDLWKKFIVKVNESDEYLEKHRTRFSERGFRHATKALREFLNKTNSNELNCITYHLGCCFELPTLIDNLESSIDNIIETLSQPYVLRQIKSSSPQGYELRIKIPKKLLIPSEITDPDKTEQDLDNTEQKVFYTKEKVFHYELGKLLTEDQKDEYNNAMEKLISGESEPLENFLENNPALMFYIEDNLYIIEILARYNYEGTYQKNPDNITNDKLDAKISSFSWNTILVTDREKDQKRSLPQGKPNRSLSEVSDATSVSLLSPDGPTPFISAANTKSMPPLGLGGSQKY